MQNTMSQPARSLRLSTIFAPSFASGSAFARVRFHTAMSHPPFARRFAISNPMRPAPIQPILLPFVPNLFGAGSMTASTVPTGTVWPASTRMAFTTPAVTDGTSVVTLSVSTSKSGSSAFTVSPTFLYQFATVPSVTVSPSCGMITSICFSVLAGQAALHFGDDPRHRRHHHVLELVGRGQRYVRGGDPDDRALELAENLLLDDRRDFRAPAAQSRILLDGEHAARARRLGEYRLRVERHERSHVDHGRVDSVGGERLGGFLRPGNHRGERDDRRVRARAQDLGFSERLDVLAVGHLALVREQALVLEEHHRIRVADRRGEQSLRVGGSRGRNHLDARDRHRPVLDALRVLRPEARARAVRGADHERYGDLPVAHGA